MCKEKSTCDTCKFWHKITNYTHENAINSGSCEQLHDVLDIDIKTGWDGGYVNRIDTNSNFGCILHENVLVSISDVL